jgi:adenine-specific DNA-methyltransferase
MIMTSLAEKEGLKGKVQTIYLDPPYGIKFGSNWQVSTRKRDIKDGKVEDASRQPEQVKAFRDTWELGVHSYLAYLRDRLVTARDLLTDTGSIFVQIGDENLHLVRSVLDEILGPENAISLITIVKTSAQEDLLLPNVCDYVLWYAKDKSQVKYRQLWLDKSSSDASASEYHRLELADGERRLMTDDEQLSPEKLPVGSRPYRQDKHCVSAPPRGFPCRVRWNNLSSHHWILENRPNWYGEAYSGETHREARANAQLRQVSRRLSGASDSKFLVGCPVLQSLRR